MKITKEYFESVICKHPQSAYRYAKDILKGRFEKAEEYIKKDPYYWNWYCKRFNL